jgi:hypothetical protein
VRFSLKLSFLIGIFTLSGACSSIGADGAPGASGQAIEGGEIDRADPAVGLLVYADGDACSGSLVAANVVLTAGHCVERRLDGFYTQGGTSHLLPGMTRHAIANKVAHPRYKAFGGCPNTTADVALVRLASSVPHAATLPFAKTAAALPSTRADLIAIGYGLHHDDAGVLEQEVQKRRATETFLDAPPNSVHVSRKSGIINHGDSGSPLLYRGVIIGVASCITGDYPAAYEAYYGRIDAVASWIEATIHAWNLH